MTSEWNQLGTTGLNFIKLSCFRFMGKLVQNKVELELNKNLDSSLSLFRISVVRNYGNTKVFIKLTPGRSVW